MYNILELLLSSLYQIFDVPMGDWNLAEIGTNAQTALLGSAPVHMLQIISVIATIVLAAAAIVLTIRKKEFNEKMAAAEQSTATVTGPLGALSEQWADVLRHIESPREGEWKFAVIEADKLLDDVLKNYFPGDTMGERLMNIDKTKLLAIDGVWEAHKIRNRLAHDTNYFLRHAEALRATRLIEAALRELGALS